jgi:hypothetical protein
MVFVILSASRQDVSCVSTSVEVLEQGSRHGNVVHSTAKRAVVIRVCPDAGLASQAVSERELRLAVQVGVQVSGNCKRATAAVMRCGCWRGVLRRV